MYVGLKSRCEIVRVFFIFSLLLNLPEHIYLLISLRKNILISFMNWQNGLFAFSLFLLIKDLLWLFVRFNLLWLFIQKLLILLDSLELAVLNRQGLMVHAIQHYGATGLNTHLRVRLRLTPAHMLSRTGHKHLIIVTVGYIKAHISSTHWNEWYDALTLFCIGDISIFHFYVVLHGVAVLLCLSQVFACKFLFH